MWRLRSRRYLNWVPSSSSSTDRQHAVHTDNVYDRHGLTQHLLAVRFVQSKRKTANEAVPCQACGADRSGIWAQARLRQLASKRPRRPLPLFGRGGGNRQKRRVSALWADRLTLTVNFPPPRLWWSSSSRHNNRKFGWCKFFANCTRTRRPAYMVCPHGNSSHSPLQ